MKARNRSVLILEHRHSSGQWLPLMTEDHTVWNSDDRETAEQIALEFYEDPKHYRIVEYVPKGDS